MNSNFVDGKISLIYKYLFPFSNSHRLNCLEEAFYSFAGTLYDEPIYLFMLWVHERRRPTLHMSATEYTERSKREREKLERI